MTDKASIFYFQSVSIEEGQASRSRTLSFQVLYDIMFYDSRDGQSIGYAFLTSNRTINLAYFIDSFHVLVTVFCCRYTILCEYNVICIMVG